MSAGNAESRSTTDHFEVLQLMPASGYQAVYCDVADDGSLIKWASPVDFLALAKWDAWHFEGGRRVQVQPMGTDIVGVEIDSDGMVYVSHESRNFCGLMKPGGDPLKVQSSMKYEFQKAKEIGVVIKEPGGL